MQFHKLPSGTIIDIDSVNRIAQPHTTEQVGTSCDYVLAGTFTVARGTDAGALYAAVDALVCNPTPAEVCSGCKALCASMDDIMYRLGAAVDAFETVQPVSARQLLTSILEDYGDPYADADEPATVDARELVAIDTTKPAADHRCEGFDALADVLAQVAKVRDTMTAYSHTWIKGELSRILSEAGWDEIEVDDRPARLRVSVEDRMMADGLRSFGQYTDAEMLAQAGITPRHEFTGEPPVNMVISILSRVRGALVAMNEGVPVAAADALEAILNDYASDYTKEREAQS
jgi:hypothetical protein